MNENIYMLVYFVCVQICSSKELSLEAAEKHGHVMIDAPVSTSLCRCCYIEMLMYPMLSLRVPLCTDKCVCL